MRRLWSGALLALAGTACVPIVAPADHLDTLPASAAAEQSETNVDVGCCFWPAVSASHTIAPTGSQHLLVDVGGQASPAAGTAAAGLWWRTAAQGGAYVGGRLGGFGGLGDAMGFASWAMPYAGFSLHGQVAGRSPDERRRWAFTFGGGYSMPITDELYWVEDLTVEHSDGTTTQGGYGLPLPQGFADIEGRLELGEGEAFTLGAAVRLSVYGTVIPRGSLGVRF